MRKFLHYLSIAAMVLATSALASCGDKEKGGDSTPTGTYKYEGRTQNIAVAFRNTWNDDGMTGHTIILSSDPAAGSNSDEPASYFTIEFSDSTLGKEFNLVNLPELGVDYDIYFVASENYDAYDYYGYEYDGEIYGYSEYKSNDTWDDATITAGTFKATRSGNSFTVNISATINGKSFACNYSGAPQIISAYSKADIKGSRMK